MIISFHRHIIVRISRRLVHLVEVNPEGDATMARQVTVGYWHIAI